MAEQIMREDVEKLTQAPSACAEVVAAGKHYLETIGAADKAAAREALAGELKEDVYGIDDLIVFASSSDGETAFGKEAAAATKTAAEAVKASGEPDCPCGTYQAEARILREAGEA